MKKSLKTLLTELIWSRGYLSTRELEAFCRENNYKISNAERRLRQSESPTIEAVRMNRVVISYKPKRTITNLPPAFKAKVEQRQQLLF